MKLRTICYGLVNSNHVINRFGNAWLIQVADGQFKLVGGSADDLAAAQEWASFFAHEIVFSLPQGRTGQVSPAVVTDRLPKPLPLLH